MSLKRTQTTQGGGERYGGGNDQPADMSDKPTNATAAQLARRKIAQPRKPSGSNRSSRAGTPTAPSAFPQQQSMPSFMSSTGQNGGGGGFNFTAGAGSNPFADANSQSGTPPPTFGQNGGSVFGGNNNSFASSFGGNNNATPAPLQNGFNPSSTSNMFSGANTMNNSTSFGGFGQNSQPQQNGVTPSTATTATFPSFGSKPANDNNANPFHGFQLAPTSQQTQSTPSTSFGGANSQQTNGDKPSATPLFNFGAQQANDKPSFFASTSETPKPSTSLFSADTPKPSSNLFGTDSSKSTTNLFSGGSLAQPNGVSKPDETPKTNTTSLFSNLQQNGASKGLFGASTQQAEERPTTPGGSVLTGLDSSRASTIKTGMFTQNKTSETPKTNLFSFKQQANENADETPKPSSNLFSAAKTNGATSNVFGNVANSSQETPAKQTGNLFSGLTGQQPQQSTSTSGLFNFGQSTQNQQDTSMTTPGNTPQKSTSNMFSQSQSQPQSQPPAIEESSAGSEPPAEQGKSLFDRVTFPEQPAAATPKPTFTPSTSMFSAANNKENEAPASKKLFDQTPSTQHQTSFTPSTSLFSKPAAQASQTPSAAPWLSHAAGALTAPTTTVTPATPKPPATASNTSATGTTMDQHLSDKESQTFKQLNDGLIKHLSSQVQNADWTSIMQYYLQQAAKIRNKSQPMFDATATAHKISSMPPATGVSGQKPLSSQRANDSSQGAQPSTSSTSSNMFGSTSTPKPPQSNSTNLFAAAQTPKQPPAQSSQLSKPPATAPVNRKRPGPFTEEEDDEVQERGPVTEKRARRDEPVNYPKLPENASNASKLMESIINTPKGKGGEVQQDTPAATPSTFGGFKPSMSSATAAPQPSTADGSTGGFKPAASKTTSDSQASSGGFTPANAGPPKFSPTAGKSGGFLAAFGKQAKRKIQDTDDDYDSDEGEDEWDKKYQEKQAAKRKKLLEDSAGTKFVFNAAAAKPGTAASVFSISATPSEASDNEADDDKADGEKAQGSGDNTWKPKTPIKFGASTSGLDSTTPAAPPPTFGNLFGSAPATGNSSLLSVPGATKPSMNFNFASNAASSTGTSRASTPGVTTDGENSTAGNDDDDESQSGEPQAEDQAGLQPQELKDHDVLFSCPTATAKKIKTKKDADASTGQTRGWQVVGIGPIYVLKNRTTGVARILQKIPPMGTAKMNFPMLAKMNYEVSGKRKQMVMGAFYDHIDEPKNPKIAQYALDVGEEYAEELAKVLNENKPAGDAE